MAFQTIANIIVCLECHLVDGYSVARDETRINAYFAGLQVNGTVSCE